MKVSIITPCYNPGIELIKTIKSVQSQSYSDYEHLIIDDSSSIVMSEELLSIISSDPKIRFISRSWNAGPAVTRNRGISEAKGRFIAFLDSDDIWHSEKLKTQIDFMVKHQIALSYTSYEVIDTRGKILGIRNPPSEMSYTDILKSNQIGCLTAIYDTSIVGKLFMPNILKRQDMGLWLKITKLGHIARGIVDKPLARYTLGENTVSSNKLSVLKYQWRIYREVEKLSFVRSVNYFRHYAYRGLIRKI